LPKWVFSHLVYWILVHVLMKFSFVSNVKIYIYIYNYKSVQNRFQHTLYNYLKLNACILNQIKRKYRYNAIENKYHAF